MPRHTGRRPGPLTDDDPRHGTYAGASAHHTQRIPMCDDCRLAERTYRRAHDALPIAQRTFRKPLTKSDPRHGTLAGYHAHRRQGVPYCAPCKDADQEATSAQRRARLDNGWCYKHGLAARVPVLDGYSLCETHLTEQRQRQLDHTERRVAAETCVRCGQNPPRKGTRFCQPCTNAKRTERLQKFGLTGDDIERMWANQNGLCAICERPLTLGSNGHALDHDHGTGKARDLLCGSCNTALGSFQDSTATLQKAIDYLNRHRAKAA